MYFGTEAKEKKGDLMNYRNMTVEEVEKAIKARGVEFGLTGKIGTVERDNGDAYFINPEVNDGEAVFLNCLDGFLFAEVSNWDRVESTLPIYK